MDGHQGRVRLQWESGEEGEGRSKTDIVTSVVDWLPVRQVNERIHTALAAGSSCFL